MIEHQGRRRRQFNKVANACEPCKRRKIKCSGLDPCVPCQARHTECFFRETEKKVPVPESYLRKLQECYAATRDQEDLDVITPGSRPSTRKTPGPIVASGVDRPLPPRGEAPVGDGPIINPLVSKISFYLKDSSGRFRFCGPSSTWSFSQRIFLLLKSELHDFPTPDFPFHVDGSSWQPKWNQTTLGNCSVLEGLPSLNDALYLLSVVRFHSYHMLFLFDEEEFLPHLHELYEKGIHKARNNQLFFIQYLLIVALAKGLLATSKSPESPPPGASIFERAMSLMPDFVGLHQNPNLGIQILNLAGLYFLSVDMKDAAYAYISQSLRMCIIEGLYRDPPSDFMGVRFANQCRNIFWTAYTLDRQISALIGAPVSIQNTEVTCSLPASYDNSEMARFMTLHVKLSQIFGDVLSSVYSADIGHRRPFISSVQLALESLANVLRDIEDVCTDTTHPSLRTVCAMSSHIYLRYHQCIILAVRPLFFYLLTGRLKKLRGQVQDEETPLPTQLRPLIETCLQSCKVLVRTLYLLYEQSSLESFLPFDLENIFSSASLLVLAAFIDPGLLPDLPDYMSIVSRMMNDIIAKGNMAAGLRRKELGLLQEMVQAVIAREGAETEGPNEDNAIDPGQVSLQSESQWAEACEGIGMSYTEIVSLAQQLDAVTDSAWGSDFEFEYNNLWM